MIEVTHLSMPQLLALRDGDASDPGLGDSRAHLERCAACRAELEAMHQRVARLRALPALRPSRDRWPAVSARLDTARRRQRRRLTGVAGLALAASVAFAMVAPRVGDRPSVVPTPVVVPTPGAATEQAIHAQVQRSQALEATLRQYDPDARLLDGRTARIAAELEDHIGDLDRQLEAAELLDAATERDSRRLELWRERVGLLDALVDVHVTRASHVGL